MKPFDDRNSAYNSPADGGELDETLRLLTRMAIPDGLEERVHARLRSVGRQSVFGQLLDHVRGIVSAPAAGWMRAVAAASLAAVVGGGGWMVYGNAHVGGMGAESGTGLSTGGAFGSAGAMRRPQPLQPPVIAPVDHAAPAGRALASGQAQVAVADHRAATGDESLAVRSANKRSKSLPKLGSHESGLPKLGGTSNQIPEAATGSDQ